MFATFLVAVLFVFIVSLIYKSEFMEGNMRLVVLKSTYEEIHAKEKLKDAAVVGAWAGLSTFIVKKAAEILSTGGESAIADILTAPETLKEMEDYVKGGVITSLYAMELREMPAHSYSPIFPVYGCGEDMDELNAQEFVEEFLANSEYGVPGFTLSNQLECINSLSVSVSLPVISSLDEFESLLSNPANVSLVVRLYNEDKNRVIWIGTGSTAYGYAKLSPYPKEDIVILSIGPQSLLDSWRDVVGEISVPEE